jgi:hypothetical protein
LGRDIKTGTIVAQGEKTMNKRHGFLFGFAVIAIAAMVTFAGCDNDTTSGGGRNLWPAEFTFSDVGYGVSIGSWDKDYTTLSFAANAEGNDWVTISPNAYELVGVNGTTYSIQLLDSEYKVTGDVYTFKATVSSTTLTISEASSGCPAANGAYTKSTY